MIISYACRGRFANNLFQYYATRILQKLLNQFKDETPYEYKYKNEIRPFQPHLESIPEGNWIQVDDALFLELYAKLRNGEYPAVLRGKNVWMFGYYQFDQFILDNIEYVRDLFSESSPDIINDQFAMNAFAYSVKNSTKKPQKEDLIVHVRLDDFVQNGANNNIISHQTMINLINKIKQENHEIKKAVIVVDKLRRDFEVFYVTNLIRGIKLENFTVEYTQGRKMEDDFATMMYATNLVCSNSTFSWWAGLLGTSEKNWFPDTQGYYQNQQFTRINGNSETYNIDYWKL